jgi:hypothetical protein
MSWTVGLLIIQNSVSDQVHQITGWRILGILSKPMKYGRPEWTRTIDLFRVKVRLTHTPNNFHVPGETAKPL